MKWYMLTMWFNFVSYVEFSDKVFWYVFIMCSIIDIHSCWFYSVF